MQHFHKKNSKKGVEDQELGTKKRLEIQGDHKGDGNCANFFSETKVMGMFLVHLRLFPHFSLRIFRPVLECALLDNT